MEEKEESTRTARPERRTIEVEGRPEPSYIREQYERNMSWNRTATVISTVAFILALGGIVFLTWQATKRTAT